MANRKGLHVGMQPAARRSLVGGAPDVGAFDGGAESAMKARGSLAWAARLAVPE
ncbi:MAG: hypothetical protein NZ533_12235 [Casimicrobiaceae bacterium]|nr:hypothetical protein [Casimicrobiaceae bacterium]